MRKSISIFTATLLTLTVMTVFLGGSSGTANAEPFSYRYVNMTSSNEDCMATAKRLFRDNKIVNISTSSTAICGSINSYHVLIAFFKQTVFISVIGQEQDKCAEIADYLKTKGAW